MSRTADHKQTFSRIALALAVAAAMTLVLMAAAATSQGGSTGGVSPYTSTSDGSGDKYDRLWKGLKRKERRWAKRTSACESGGDPEIHGGGGMYHGAFQFMKSTWETSPKSPGGDPHAYRWRVQAVVAVYLKRRDGAGHWPNCG